jgi:hypothetical protein
VKRIDKEIEIIKSKAANNSTAEGLLAKRPQKEQPKFDAAKVKQRIVFEAKEYKSALFYRNGDVNARCSLKFSKLYLYPDIKSILVFIEHSSGRDTVPDGANLAYFQTKDLFAQIPVFDVYNEVSLVKETPLLIDGITRYSFYAIYLDKDGNPIYDGKRLVFSVQLNVIFTGLNYDNTIFGVKGLRVIKPEIEMDDIDGLGYSIPYQLDENYVRLQWTPLEEIAENFSQYAGAGNFVDTFGQLWELEPAHLKKLDYYVVYEFRSEGLKPEPKYPFGIIPRISLAPRFSDRNGIWKVVTTTKDAEIEIVPPAGMYVGYFVGVKLK